MNNLTPTILIMISIIGLVITVPLLFYYGQNVALEILFWILIALGIAACVLWIVYRTPDLEKIKNNQMIIDNSLEDNDKDDYDNNNYDKDNKDDKDDKDNYVKDDYVDDNYVKDNYVNDM